MALAISAKRIMIRGAHRLQPHFTRYYGIISAPIRMSSLLAPDKSSRLRGTRRRKCSTLKIGRRLRHGNGANPSPPPAPALLRGRGNIAA